MKRISFFRFFVFNFLFIGLFVALFSYQADADNLADIKEKKLNIDQVVEMALEANHKIHISKIDFTKSMEAKKEAFTDFLPEFKTGYGYTYKSEVDQVTLDKTRYYFGDQDNYQWRISIIQSIFTGLSTYTNYQVADLNLEIASIRQAVTRLDIIFEAKKRFFAVQNAKLLVEVGDKSVRSLQEHLSVAVEYYDVGLSPKIDVLNAEVELANAEQYLERSKNHVIIAKAALNNILVLPVDTPVDVVDTLKHNPVSISYEKCSAKAIKLRPGLKEAKKNIQVAEKKIRLARSNYLPDITASMNYNRFGDSLNVDGSDDYDRENWNAMVRAEWTFFEWGKTRHSVAQAKQNLKKAVKQLAIVEDRIRFEVKKAFQDVKTAHHNIKTAKKGVVSAEENLEISSERYKEQVATTTEVMDAQTRLTKAMTSYTNVLNDYNVALASLYRAMGEE